MLHFSGLTQGRSGLPVRMSVIESIGSVAHLMTFYIEREATAMIRERHGFRSGRILHPRCMVGMFHALSPETGGCLP